MHGLLLGAAAVVAGAGLGSALALSAIGEPPSFLAVPVALFAIGAVAFALGVRSSDRDDDPANAVALFRRELARARRLQEPLTLLRIRAADRVDAARRGRQIEHIVRRLLRLTDIVWDEGESVYVAMPNTNRASAGRWLARLERAADLRPTELTIAVFPDDALTESALMDALSTEAPSRRQQAHAWDEPALERVERDPAAQPGPGVR